MNDKKNVEKKLQSKWNFLSGKKGYIIAPEELFSKMDQEV